jgi:hypothetical protein
MRVVEHTVLHTPLLILTRSTTLEVGAHISHNQHSKGEERKKTLFDINHIS